MVKSKEITKREVKNSAGKVFCTMQFLPEHNCNYVAWNGFSSVDDVKAGLNAALELINLNKCPNLINDSELSTGPWHGANEWIMTDWTPRAYKAGLRFSKIVVAKNVFSAMSAQQLLEKNIIQGVELSSYKDKESAFADLNK